MQNSTDELNKVADKFYHELLESLGSPVDLRYPSQVERELKKPESRLNKDLACYFGCIQMNQLFEQEMQDLYLKELAEIESDWYARNAPGEDDTYRGDASGKPFIDPNQHQIETARNNISYLLHENEKLKSKLDSFITNMIQSKEKVVFAGHRARTDALREVINRLDPMEVSADRINWYENLYARNLERQRIMEDPVRMQNHIAEMVAAGRVGNPAFSESDARMQFLLETQSLNDIMYNIIKEEAPDLAKKIDIESEKQKLNDIDKSFAQEAAPILQEMQQNNAKINRLSDSIENFTGEKPKIKLDLDADNSPLKNGFLQQFVSSNAPQSGNNNDNGLDARAQSPQRLSS